MCWTTMTLHIVIIICITIIIFAIAWLVINILKNRTRIQIERERQQNYNNILEHIQMRELHNAGTYLIECQGPVTVRHVDEQQPHE